MSVVVWPYVEIGKSAPQPRCIELTKYFSFRHNNMTSIFQPINNKSNVGLSSDVVIDNI